MKSSSGITLEVIDSTGVYDYSWSEFAVLRGDDGYLYVGSDSGCSCNSFGDYGLDVEKVDSWQAATAKAQEWAGGNGTNAPYEDSERRGCMDMIERLSVSRPAAFDAGSVVTR